MTADRYPGEMVGLQDRLLSRFESGLHADIQPPDFETRVAILSTKAKQNNMKIEGSHLEKIASHVRTNIRDLESCVTKIFAHATLSGDKINEALVVSAEFVASFLFPRKKWWGSPEEKTLQKQDRLQHIWRERFWICP
jgi:chromosomal replication initiator protein